MSRFSRESWRLELGHRSVEVSWRARGSPDWHSRATAAVDFDKGSSTATGDNAALEPMRALVETHIPARATVATVIGDECARYAVVNPPVNARRPGELRFAALARMKTLFEDVGADWLVDADWSATRRFLACAVPAAMVHTSRRCLAESGRRNGGTGTEFVAAWNAHCARLQETDAWVAHAGRESLVIAACEAARISQISVCRVSVPCASGEAMAEMRRCALRWNLPVPETAYLLGAGFQGADGSPVGAAVDLASPSLQLAVTGGAVTHEDVA